MTSFIIHVPRPNMWNLESFNLFVPPLFNRLNIFCLNPLPVMPPSFLLRIFSPQKVKNMVTSIPMLAPVVAMIKAARALSNSPLKTTMVSFSFSFSGIGLTSFGSLSLHPGAAMRAGRSHRSHGQSTPGAGYRPEAAGLAVRERRLGYFGITKRTGMPWFYRLILFLHDY